MLYGTHEKLSNKISKVRYIQVYVCLQPVPKFIQTVANCKQTCFL